MMYAMVAVKRTMSNITRQSIQFHAKEYFPKRQYCESWLSVIKRIPMKTPAIRKNWDVSVAYQVSLRRNILALRQNATTTNRYEVKRDDNITNKTTSITGVETNGAITEEELVQYTNREDPEPWNDNDIKYWLSTMESVTKPSAFQMLTRLDKSDPMGVDTSMKGVSVAKGSLYHFTVNIRLRQVRPSLMI